MKSLTLSVFLSLGQAAAASGAPPAEYTIFDVKGAGTLSGQGTMPNALNTSSASTGVYIDSNNNFHGFLRAADGTTTTIDVGPSGETVATAINREGAVAGYYLKKNQISNNGFLRRNGGRTEKFSAGGFSTGAQGLNDNGDAVGNTTSEKDHIAAYLRAPDGSITDIKDPKAGRGVGEGTFASAINNGGVITGRYESNSAAHGYVRDADGTFTNFDAAGAGGFFGTSPAAINKNGLVAGTYTDTKNVLHAFIRDPAGTITSFDAPGAGTSANEGTSAYSVANDGAVVGSYIDANDVSHGFLRLKNGTIREFDAPGAGTGGGEGTIAVSINSAHVIAGYEVDENSVYHGFLRTP
jgi:hypothetical protein